MTKNEIQSASAKRRHRNRSWAQKVSAEKKRTGMERYYAALSDEDKAAKSARISRGMKRRWEGLDAEQRKAIMDKVRYPMTKEGRGT